jgi:predicted metal-binding membrane protein
MDPTASLKPQPSRDLRLWVLGRGVPIAGIAVTTALAWAYLLTGAGTGMSAWQMTPWPWPEFFSSDGSRTWDLSYALIMLAMWWVMMIAMMLPSAAPFILVFDGVAKRTPQGSMLTAVFTAGYLLSWLAFSVAATGAQWALEALGLLHSTWMWTTSRWLAAGLFIGAGLHQFSSTKRACLAHCQAPLPYLSGHWKRGWGGALRMGLVHGNQCVGCCWLVMALLFAGGLMNLFWIAALSVVVLLEKIRPFGLDLRPGLGVLFLVAGVVFGVWAMMRV